MSSRRGTPGGASPDRTPSLALGYLAALPLFLAYEVGLALGPGELARASAETVVVRGLSFLGERLQGVRLALLLVAAVLAGVQLRREPERSAPGRAWAGQIGLGIVAGFLLGPLLAVLQGWLGAAPLESAPERARGLAAALRLMGAAPWEELLFRVGVYGCLYLLVRRTSAFLGLGSPLARAGAELAALLASAVLFALFHLEIVQRQLWTMGEPFHGGLFLWRVSAGLLLGALFRWRGLGVAAWAHAVFNLGVALGLGPA